MTGNSTAGAPTAGCNGARLRAATAADHAAIASLQAASFPDRWTLDAVRRMTELAGAIVLVAEADQADGSADGALLGYLIGQVVTDEAEVHSIAVAEAARRRGIGRSLLAAFEAMAGALGAVSIVLEVAADDPVARGLYDSAGYAVIARRRGYYRIGRPVPVDAEVRRRALSS